MRSDERTVDIGGGRRLGYREFGDPAGRPVVNCHGGLVCGLDVAAFHDAAIEAGVRIVSPDRPGIAGSDPQPGRTTADWAADIGTLLDRLGLSRVAVFGWSMGGQYALACAALLPDRVARTLVVAGALPLDDEPTFAELNRMDRRLTLLARHRPHVARIAFATLGRLARHAPGAWTRAITRDAVPDEARALRAIPDAGLASAAVAALTDPAGMIEEYRAWVRPWGFTPESIAGPVHVWQGDADTLVPPRWGTELTRRIPGAQLSLLPREGHFLAYRHRTEILSDLVG